MWWDAAGGGIVCGVVRSAADRQIALDDRYARIVKPGPPFPHCKKQLGPGDGSIYLRMLV